MIIRNEDILSIRKLLTIFPITCILGARQIGKTTLAKQFPFDHYFDLENPEDLIKFDNPKTLLESLSGLIVIDEIHMKAELFPLLRYLTDQNLNQKYLILGSASANLLRQSSESLAGRIGYHYLDGFRLDEVSFQTDHLWLKGAYPRSFLLEDDESFTWRQFYLTVFLEKDLPQFGIHIPSTTIRRFWTMIAHYHGQTVNYSAIGRNFGISDHTVRSYLDLLEKTFMVRLINPWFPNIKKRMVKSPKIYIRDNGILHYLLGIRNKNQLLSNPILGASWEGFVIEELLKILKSFNFSFYFCSTYAGTEVDLFWQSGEKNYCMEVKFSDAPGITKSMQETIKILDIDQMWVVYPGRTSYPLSEKIMVVPVTGINSIAEKMG